MDSSNLCRLHFCHMGQTITFRPTKKLAGWIERAAQQMGVSQSQFIRSHLEQARAGDRKSRKFMRLAGLIRGGPRGVSERKGFLTKGRATLIPASWLLSPEAATCTTIGPRVWLKK